MVRTDFSEMNCSIARALDVLGGWWAPLIIRDLLVGVRQFDEMRRDLGISTNVLTDRLNRLLDHGVIERSPYGSHPHRYEYRLTPKGEDAVPVLLALLAWGDRWASDGDGPPTEVVHEPCGAPTTPVLRCSDCGETLEAADLRYRNGPGARSGPGTAVLRERLAEQPG
jgi:DNA-binding HxlR family transcriptional regulator